MNGTFQQVREDLLADGIDLWGALEVNFGAPARDSEVLTPAPHWKYIITIMLTQCQGVGESIRGSISGGMRVSEDR